MATLITEVMDEETTISEVEVVDQEEEEADLETKSSASYVRNQAPVLINVGIYQALCQMVLK